MTAMKTIESREWRWTYLYGADHRTTAGRILTDGRITRAIFERNYSSETCVVILQKGKGEWTPAAVWRNRESRPLGVDLSVSRLEDLVLREGERSWEPAEQAFAEGRSTRSWECCATEGPETEDGKKVLSVLYPMGW